MSTNLAAALLLCATVLSAEPGPSKGQVLPTFRLTDQHGKEQTLASLTGPKGAILVFYRSADW